MHDKESKLKDKELDRLPITYDNVAKICIQNYRFFALIDKTCLPVCEINFRKIQSI